MSKSTSTLTREERDLLIKIDANLQNLNDRFLNFQDRMSMRVEILEKTKAERQDLSDLKNAIMSTLDSAIKNNGDKIDELVSLDQFDPIKRLVYGTLSAVGIQLIVVVTGVILWVLNNKSFN